MPYRKLGRSRSPRKAVLRNLVTALLDKERIDTTEAKAKEVSTLADKMITLAKRGDLHARRQVLSFVLDESVVKKLFDSIGPRYRDKNGGYTRVVKLGSRIGDAAPMARVELV